MKADKNKVEQELMLNPSVLLNFFILGQNSHVFTANVHTNIDVATIAKWQTVHKKAIDQKQYRVNAYYTSNYNSFIENLAVKETYY